ncbi:unnamed protein product [Urochloa decumbens]|uniref:Reverse transcriptase zinc-binding domain-containing protein n=1 Tax=Urochloa decumbens TaxID=240449 RepID=A0ABC9AS35_9POAL
MFVLPSPLTVLAKLNRPCKGLFWAGAPKCSGGACQVARELACRSKEDGGLSLKDLATLNKSLMMKHVHKLFTRESNPWTDWICYWYDEGHADEDMSCWRDIKKLIPEYRQLTVVALGEGETTSFWHDTWSEAGVLQHALPALYSHCLDIDATVAEVVAAGVLTAGDLQPRLTATASADLAVLDAAMPTMTLHPRPSERWLQGHRSTKKVKVFFCILRHGRTHTRASLHRHGALDTPDCPFCPGTPEDEDHLLATCPRLLQLWARLLLGQAPPTTARHAAEALGALFPALPGTVTHTVAIAVLWVIWKARNAMIFNADPQNAGTIARQLQTLLKLWVCRAPSKLVVEPLKVWCQTVVDVN